MCLFIETIRIENGKAWNMALHEERMNRTRRSFFGKVTDLHLCAYLHPEACIERTRCRVTYGAEIVRVEYFPYYLRQVDTLKLLERNDIDYSYKWADRSVLDEAFACRGKADEVLIVRRGVLTDTSIANIALWNGKEWHTPAKPLLEGTCRRALLNAGVVKETNIPVTSLKKYRYIRLFNAMIPFGEIELPVERILPLSY